MKIELPKDWYNHLEKELNLPYIIHELEQFLTSEYQNKDIFPAEADIFAALVATPYDKVQVVILGQDPYHGVGQAQGLSFSVQPGQKLPPSLRNIYQELEDDLGIKKENGSLLSWAEQGVLLLNTVLTVQSGAANSHKGKGWEKLTDAIIKELNKRKSPIIFVLWGKPAQQKKAMIDSTKHFIIEAPHPSPLSAYRGFFGSKPFSLINHLLTEQGKVKINW